MTPLQPEDDILSLKTKRKRPDANVYEETDKKVRLTLPLALQSIAAINRDQLASNPLPIWTGGKCARYSKSHTSLGSSRSPRYTPASTSNRDFSHFRPAFKNAPPKPSLSAPTLTPAFNTPTNNRLAYSTATMNTPFYDASSYGTPSLTTNILSAHKNKGSITNALEKPPTILGNVSNVEAKPPTDIARMILTHFRSRAPADPKPCLLMKLPAELRNRVMETLFQTKTKTVYIRQRGILFGFEENADGPGEPMNQVQYVSKQLHHGYQYYELKHNKLVAIGKNFIRLVQHGKPNLKARVRDIELMPLKELFFQYMTPNPNVLPVFIDFCFHCPEANLKIRIEAIKFEGQMASGRLGGKISQKTCNVSVFVGLATIIQNSIRGIEAPIWSAGSNPCIVWGAGRLVPQLNASNLKFFPCDEKFDPGKFTAAWKTTKTWNKNKIFTRLGGSEQAVRNEIETWYKKGL